MKQYTSGLERTSDKEGSFTSNAGINSRRENLLFMAQDLIYQTV
ncbi:hypothetical protein IX312_002036 [Porphyromonas levii]|nr:hypothetical protein [Porphyromonas levii]